MGERGPVRGTGGRPKKPLSDKIAEGNRGHRKLEVIDFGDDAVKFEGVEMPRPSDMLSATQRDGTKLQAGEIYEATWKWLDERGCATLISPMLLERYSMAAARWIHCESIITATVYLSRHPTTQMAIASPYVSMSQNYMAQTNRLWAEIYGIVRENCSAEFTSSNPQDNVMERLLNARTRRND